MAIPEPNYECIRRARWTNKPKEETPVITHELIEKIFTYHAPEGDQPLRYDAIRRDAKVLAHTILTNTPRCADQTAAIRKLRETVMVANAAIALEGKV